MEGCRPCGCCGATGLQLCLDSLCVCRRAARRPHPRQQEGTEAGVQGGAVAVMKHGVGVRVMGVARMHMSVHLVDVRVSGSTLASQAVRPGVSEG